MLTTKKGRQAIKSVAGCAGFVAMSLLGALASLAVIAPMASRLVLQFSLGVAIFMFAVMFTGFVLAPKYANFAALFTLAVLCLFVIISLGSGFVAPVGLFVHYGVTVLASVLFLPRQQNSQVSP